MTIYGHVEVMLQAKISELKGKLSSYVARVRGGETVLVLDRQTPVAKLVPLHDESALLVREATRSNAALPRRSRLRLPRPIDVVALLREDRDGR